MVGEAYEGKGAYEEAEKYFKKYVALIEVASGKNHVYTGESYGTLGDFYLHKKEYQKSLDLFHRAARIFETALGSDHPKTLKAVQNVGINYASQKKYDQAMSIFTTTFEKIEKNNTVNTSLKADFLRDIIEVQYDAKDYNQALGNIDKGFKYLDPGFDASSENLAKNPRINSIVDRLEGLKYLDLKSKLLVKKHEQDKEIETLKAALQTSELAIQLIEQLRRTYLSTSTRAALNTRTTRIFDRAVEQAYLLYELSGDKRYLYKALEIADQAKANILWQNQNEKYAFQSGTISESILDSIRNYQRRITRAEVKFLKINDPEESKILREKIIGLRVQLEQQIKLLEESNPEYYQSKYKLATISIDETIKSIQSGASLLHYYLTDEHLFIFAFDDKMLHGFKKERAKNLDELIFSLRADDFINAVREPKVIRQSLNNMNLLYDYLLSPVASVIEEADQLIIVPHDVLHYLSFDLLTSNNDENDFKNQHYLIEKYAIEYAWSIALWNKNVEKPSSFSNEFLGMAPGFLSTDNTASTLIAANRSIQQPLPHTIKEVDRCQQYFNGLSYINEEATETMFVSRAPKSRIIHLATHGMVNSRFPLESGLVFSERNDQEDDGFLSALEIYNLDLNADLTIMSACNTGYGKQQKGEGVMSLGRAFMAAGSRSVMMSLWAANDASTSLIIQQFYQYVTNGMSKQKALRQAKLDYLNQADPLTAHPFFWANLVVVGDMSSIDQGHSYGYLILIIAGLGLISLMVYQYFSAKSSKLSAK